MAESMPGAHAPPEFSKRLEWAGYLLGFGFGGFFDGILLHQVLQWHHLLSGVDGAGVQDIRVQILADGLFHVLMYVVAFAGLWLLWRARAEFAGEGADRRMFANALIGFGVWHVLDGVLSHWLLGIHRIRMDVDNPLFWDLSWFFVFGVAILAAGWAIRRGRGAGGSGGSGARRAVAPVLLALAVTIAGPVAALPPPNVDTVLVLFKPGTTSAEAMVAASAVDGRVVWSDRSGQLWAFDLSTGGNANRLYRHGALLVGSGLLPTVCFNWSRI